MLWLVITNIQQTTILDSCLARSRPELLQGGSLPLRRCQPLPAIVFFNYFSNISISDILSLCLAFRVYVFMLFYYLYMQITLIFIYIRKKVQIINSVTTVWQLVPSKPRMRTTANLDFPRPFTGFP